ncbi:hypothetical protein HNO89_000061 [Sporosarcina luteola]|nr:hypothetical protein [Sporosarcina luteola]
MPVDITKADSASHLALVALDLADSVSHLALTAWIWRNVCLIWHSPHGFGEWVSHMALTA